MPVFSWQGLEISYPDQLEFETLFEEVFKQHTYYVDLPTQSPVIIDIGAHIGDTMLYFAKQYPHARIICVEPNPTLLSYLYKNIEQNNLDSIEVIPKAVVGKHAGATATLYTHPQWGVFSSLQKGGWTGDQELTPVPVETIRLSELITEPVDLLKIDVEGMETEILEEAKDKLALVSHLFVEFHETKTRTSEKILRIIHEHFNEVTIEKDKRKEKKKSDQLFLISATK